MRLVINPTIWLALCSSSVMSILPSANPTVKMPMSIPVQNFLHDQNPGKIPFICSSTESLSIIQAIRQSTRHCLLQTHQKSHVIMGRNPQ